jgi:hypothetical protein
MVFGVALVVLTLVIGLQLAAPSRAYSDAQTKILGKTYGEWSAAWWQWAVIEPPTSNPLPDVTGAFADRNQKGPVWFLAGTTVPVAVTRTVTIPKGKYIFFPIVNIFQGNGPLHDPIPPIINEDQERETLFQYINAIGSNMICILDGVPVAKNPQTPIVRSQSPVWTLTFFSDNNIFIDWGYPTGDYFPTVSDGYWVMLPPLSPGHHTLHFEDGTGFQNVTYELTVE